MVNKRLLLFCFLIAFAVKGQLQKTIDSLENAILNTQAYSKERVDILNRLGYQYWVRDSKTAVKYGDSALNIAKRINYPGGKAMANRILGVGYWTFGKPKLALEHLMASQKLYQELGDSEGAANALMNSGMVYADIGEYDKALKIYEQSIQRFSELNLKRRIATTFTKMGTVLLRQNQLMEAKKHLNNALKMHIDDAYIYGQAEAHNRLGELLLIEDELEQAEYHIGKAMELSGSISDEDGILSSKILLGKLERLRGNLTNANNILSETRSEARLRNLKKYELASLRQLKVLKKQEGRYIESIKYYDAFIKLRDSLFNTEKSKQIAVLELNNDLVQKKAEIAILEETEKTKNIINLSLGFGLFALAIIGFLVFRQHRQRQKRELELLRSQERFALKELENSELKQRELKQHLEFRNKELVSYTLNFKRKNELFNELLSQLNKLQNATSKSQSKLLAEIKTKIKSHLNSDKEWDDFKRYFEEVHVDFYSRLKDGHPDLSPNDLKICALTRLNLNIKETANILGISPESAKTARYRLRKKLNLAAEMDLFDYLLRIEG